jgi:hypothetical protein
LQVLLQRLKAERLVTQTSKPQRKYPNIVGTVVQDKCFNPLGMYLEKARATWLCGHLGILPHQQHMQNND